jgi:mono/diheme cytochrome c family protein
MIIRVGGLSLALLASFASFRVRGLQDDAKAVYDQNCMQCHGVRGLPPKNVKSALSKIPTFDSAFIAVRTDDSIVKVLTNGKGGDMPSFKGKLTSSQMATLAKYVRALASK